MSKRKSDDLFSSMDEHSFSQPKTKTFKLTTSKKGLVVKKSGGPKTSFAAKVKKVLRSNAEKKQIDSLQSWTQFGSAASSTHLIVNLLPNAATLDISQGASVQQRIGNRVRIKKVTFRGQLMPAPYNGTTNTTPEPQNVKMWFVSNRGDPADPATPTIGPWFRAGSTTSSMTGTVTDHIRQMDHESLRVYHEELFKVGHAQYGTAGVGGATDAEYWYANNDSQERGLFNFDVTKWCPKEIVWDDTTVAPLSRQLSCVIQSTNAVSGTAMGVTAQSLVSAIMYQIHIEYTDI